MGSKCNLIVLADGIPKATIASDAAPDPIRTVSALREFFPGVDFQPTGDTELDDVWPSRGELHACVIDDVFMIADQDIEWFEPTDEISKRLHAPRAYLFGMHSVSDWGGFVMLEDGRVRRYVNLTCDDGVIDDVGEPLEFEVPYWSGEHDDLEEEGYDDHEQDGYDDATLRFHPIDFVNAGLRHLVGVQTEGLVGDPQLLDLKQARFLRYAKPEGVSLYGGAL